jgi:hypothetical protein
MQPKNRAGKMPGKVPAPAMPALRFGMALLGSSIPRFLPFVASSLRRFGARRA